MPVGGQVRARSGTVAHGGSSLVACLQEGISSCKDKFSLIEYLHCALAPTSSLDATMHTGAIDFAGYNPDTCKGFVENSLFWFNQADAHGGAINIHAAC